MEEGSGCGQCRTWEEEMYWKHFSSMHFCQILPKDFHDHLVLPVKFAENMICKVPDKVSLIGPSGTVWDVELKKTNNMAFAGDGWKAFVKACDLEENCILVFKFTRNFGFEVLIFNPDSLCEKEASYFVKKCGHTESDHQTGKKKRHVREAFSTEVIEDKDEDDNSSEFVASKKARKDVEELVTVGQKDNPQTAQKEAFSTGVMEDKDEDDNSSEFVASKKAMKDVEELVTVGQKDNPQTPQKELPDAVTKGCKKGRGRVAGRPKKRVVPQKSPSKLKVQSGKKLNRTEAAEGQSSPEVGGSTLEMGQSQKSSETRGRPKKRVAPKSSRKLAFQSDSAERYAKEYVSNRRPVTEIEKEKALQMAHKEQTEKSFVAVMRPTSVYKRFYLNIPLRWMFKYLPHRHHEVILRVGDKTWLTMFYYHSTKGGGLSPGWKKFALDNCLEEFDVCLFKLASQKDDPALVFDVDIFRVIPETVPLSPVVSSLA